MWSRLSALSQRFARREGLSPALIMWVAAGSLTAMFAIFGYVLYASRLDVRDAAWTSSSNIVGAVSQEIGREIELLDMSLLDLRDGAQQPSMLMLPAELRQAVLFDRAGSARGLGALFLLDAAGHVVEQAGILSPQPVDLSSEAFFQVHRTGRATGLFISHPFVSFVDGETSFALSRRVEREGRFAGVAVATIKLSHLRGVLKHLDLGPDDSMSLFDADGTIIVRLPFLQAAPMRSALVGQRIAQLGATQSGWFDAPSIVDGVDRVYFYSHVGTTPLVLFLGRSRGDIFAAWWNRAALTAVVILLLGNTILLLIVVLQAELRGRKAAEAALAILATTDKLTGLANRRELDATLDVAWKQARAAKRPVALLLIDIDHFKALNDHVGHQAGDVSLATVGTCLMGLVRHPGGFAARYGGEEFAILLTGAGADEAESFAEVVRLRIQELGLPHPTSGSGRLTASVGVATLVPTLDSTAADLLRAADAALYTAKRSGRNQVIVAAEPAVAA